MKRYVGIARGKSIELPGALPFPGGQSVEPIGASGSVGSPSELRRARQLSCPLSPLDVDEMERAIEAGKLAVAEPPVFNPGDEF